MKFLKIDPPVEKDDVAKAGVKILSETAAFWTHVKTAAEEEIKASKNSILLNEEIAKIAKEKIKSCT